MFHDDKMRFLMQKMDDFKDKPKTSTETLSPFRPMNPIFASLFGPNSP